MLAPNPLPLPSSTMGAPMPPIHGASFPANGISTLPAPVPSSTMGAPVPPVHHQTLEPRIITAEHQNGRLGGGAPQSYAQTVSPEPAEVHLPVPMEASVVFRQRRPTMTMTSTPKPSMIIRRPTLTPLLPVPGSSPAGSTPNRGGAPRSPSLDADPLLSSFIVGLDAGLKSTRQDIRDTWSNKLTIDYQRGDAISAGRFGMVQCAVVKEANAKGRGQPRSCILSTRYVGKRVIKILEDCRDKETDLKNRLNSLAKSIVLEIYIMNRFRHANIMHTHCVSVSSQCVTLVLPRLYSLEGLIEQYRKKNNGEAIPADIIMRVVRQICIGLDYLHNANIAHRMLEACHVYITRGGTVKLSHFGAVGLLTDSAPSITPVGSREYMSYEKQFNLCHAETRESCLQYDHSADIWALGVLVLRMVSYFPNERWQKLPVDFAMAMQDEGMPFKWVIADMMQLRVRLRKAAGDEDLRSWLSDKLLTSDPQRRASAAELLQSSTLNKLCSPSIVDDRKYIVNKFIEVLDWPNRDRIETNRPNYEYLESKDIPAEFYWDEKGTWKELERAEFEYTGELGNKDGKTSIISGMFVFSQAQVLLTQLAAFVEDSRINWFDVLPIDYVIRDCACSAMSIHAYGRCKTEPERKFRLPQSLDFTDRYCKLSVRLVRFVEQA